MRSRLVPEPAEHPADRIPDDSRLLPALLVLAAVALAPACGDDSSAASGEVYRRLVPELSVSGVSIFQSVEVPLWVAGEERADLNAVVVAGKAATVVVFLDPAPEFDGREVTIALALDRGAGPAWQHTTFVPSGPSSLERPESVVEFELSADEVSGELSLAVAVVDPLAPVVPVGTSHAARYPADGSLRPVQLGSVPDPVRLVLIPVRYAREGTEYVPDTSPEQLELYRRTLTATYPAVAWDIVLHEELYWDQPPTWSGFNFGALNAHVSDLKASEGEIPQSHYYSLVAPDATFAAYCTPMCVAGESYLVTDARMSDLRVGSGLGFTGAASAWTMVHELGHEFGRGHSGCSVPRDDRDYPYDGGLIGVWGRDPRDGRYLPPSTADFMGYCSPVWVSDFTWNRLFERLEALAGLGAKRLSDRFRILHVDLDAGVSSWGAETVFDRQAPSETVAARFAGDDAGSTTELPIVWQSGLRHAAVLVPLDFAPRLLDLPGLVPAPVP
ncbi:MAG: hypothetical protein JXB32_15310 [Deltaproteobacteria bacterium]|nr:hypothetical protein [Deltaproteobacteria bacterium]